MFSIERQVKNQINIIVPKLNDEQRLAGVLQRLLLKRESIKRVEVDLKKKTLEIEFDEKKISKENLLQLLNVVLKNFTQTGSFKDSRLEKIETDIAKQNFDFKVEGMSCSSCALFLEMALSCHPGVDNIKIDYDSNSGSISGNIEWAEIARLVEDKGYHVSMIDKSSSVKDKVKVEG